jgi:MFS family permease
MAFIFHLPPLLYIGALFLGLSGILFTPAQQAVIPLLVPKDDLAEANALNSGMSGVVCIAGAICGGIVASTLSPIICFIINSASYLWSAICIYQAKWTDTRQTSERTVPYFLSIIFIGLLMRISAGIIIPLDTYLLQLSTQDKIRGRVFSLHGSTYSGVMQLSYAVLAIYLNDLVFLLWE